jgi:hypothetical protein
MMMMTLKIFNGAKATNDGKDQVHAIGPELSVFVPQAKLFVNLRTLFEYGAEGRSEGNVITLTFTKIF